jgi:hypothetical protein
MHIQGSPLVGFDFRLVALSGLALIVATYATLALADQVLARWGLVCMARWGCVRNGNRDLVDALPRPEGPRLARTDVEQPGCPSFNIGGNFRFRYHFACSEREK